MIPRQGATGIYCGSVLRVCLWFNSSLLAVFIDLHLIWFSPSHPTCGLRYYGFGWLLTTNLVSTGLHTLLPPVRETSRGKTLHLRSIHLPHLHSRVRVPFGFGLLCNLAPIEMPSMWFVFLRPELFLRLPLDSTSWWTPLPLACTWSLPTRAGDFHPRMKRHARRTTSRGHPHDAPWLPWLTSSYAVLNRYAQPPATGKLSELTLKADSLCVVDEYWTATDQPGESTLKDSDPATAIYLLIHCLNGSASTCRITDYLPCQQQARLLPGG